MDKYEEATNAQVFQARLFGVFSIGAGIFTIAESNSGWAIIGGVSTILHASIAIKSGFNAISGHMRIVAAENLQALEMSAEHIAKKVATALEESAPPKPSAQ